MAFYYKCCITIFLCSLLCFIPSSVESVENGGITVDFIHRDSTLSPHYDPSSTRFQRLRSAFDRSFSRKSSFMSSVSTDSIAAPVSPLFDPSRTSTYRTVSCQSPKCDAAGSPSCDGRNGCQYQVAYGDSSYSVGELAVDTLSFDGGVSFPKVAFGCGHESAGTFSQAGSGIVGLGGGSISIVNQLKSSIGGKFSYCLTMLDSNASSKISLGRNAVVAGSKVVSTPLVKKSPATFYYLTLEGLSVGEERMDYVSSSAEELAADKGNIIIDSGTTLTFVPSELYDSVESALEEAITGTRVSDSRGMFKLCYQVGSEAKLSSPPVTAHFKGADLLLPEESIFVEVEAGIACLTLVPSQDLAIFGNLHQINYHIGYDLVKGKVSFLPTDCSKSQKNL